jgi:D-3-phosphoglycerate dehydrogenase
VLHGTSPRLLTYDGIDIEAPLQGTLVAIRNHDVPGVVGRIGTILGEHGINIANFALGRPVSRENARSQRVPQGQAIAVVQVDVPDTQTFAPAIAALKAVEAIASVRTIELGKA